MKNVFMEKNTNSINYEDDNIFIEIDNRCNNKDYLQIIKENYEKYGEDFIKKIDNINYIYETHIYDKKNKKTILISDIVGLNTIYYYKNDDSLFFNNDIIKLVNTSNVTKQININSLSIYFKYHYIYSPETIFKNVFALKHGEYLIYQNKKLEVKTYWNIIDKYNKNKKNLLKSYKECENKLDNILNTNIKEILTDKDDFGIYLSGGIDSSLITALSKKYSEKTIKTFSIGFYEQEYNEAQKAKKIANYLGTDHHELYIDEKKAIETVKKIPKYYSEPFADASALATIVLNEFAKENGIKKVLTGDGADQLFCGCKIFDTIYKTQKTHMILNPLNIYINPKLYKYKRKFFYIFSNSNKQYQDQCDILYNEQLLEGLFKYSDNFSRKLKSDIKINSRNWQEKRMIFDFDTFCCKQVLTKMGVASRKNNISVYSPFLNKELIEFTFRIPHKFKYYKKIKKYILKEVLFKYLPKELFAKNKRGFAIPTKNWLTTYFYDDLKRLSNQDFIKKQDIFNYDKICFLLNNINDKKYAHIIWDYYIFQLWYEMYML